MKSTKYNEGWKFWKDKDSFALVWNVPENARDISLPHDAMIEDPADENSPNGGNTGFRTGEIYNYVKLIDVPLAWRDQTILLQFEGVYMNAFVYVNGQMVTKNPNGYTTFYASLNDYLKYGRRNEIRVQVRAGAMTNSRWYSGAGIYRDVYLLESGKTFICPGSLQLQTLEAGENLAVLKTRMEIENKEPFAKELIAETVIYDPEGKEAGREKTRMALFGTEKRRISQRITLENPSLWSEESPCLYTAKVCLWQKKDDGRYQEIDTQEDTFGIRLLGLNAKKGLTVNGKSIKLRGACIHHDSGLLGAATYEDAQYREVRKLKEAGFNAIRMSHHPMAPAMLRACDALGMYVMDETFDMWNRPKSDYDYGLFFAERWESDVTAMVKKDFNHPSVILYSVGNEIPEIGTDHGAATCDAICSLIRSLDDTRFTTAGINGVFIAGDEVDEIVSDILGKNEEKENTTGNVNDFMTVMDDHMDEIVTHRIISERLEKACAPLDIAGYNYMTARYERDGIDYPNRVIVGSETYPPQIARNWELVMAYPHLIGDFTWSGWDYIGEAGVGIPAYCWGEGGFGAAFPAQLSYAGDIDITGFRRPASYYRERVFGFGQTPYIAVQNPYHYGEVLIKTPWVISDAIASWTYQGMEGKPVIAEVYSQGEEVELLLNGRSIARKPAGKQAQFRTLFELTYEPGELCAITYENGQEIGRSSLFTAGKARRLVLTQEPYAGPEKKAQELVYIEVWMCDEKGVPACDENQEIMLRTKGNAQILGFGSADPKPIHNYNEGITTLFNGRAQIVMKKPLEETELFVWTKEGLCGSIVIS